MSITSSALVALILMTIVFIALAVLSALLKLQAFIINSLYKAENENKVDLQFSSNTASNQKTIDMSQGEIELVNVDEETAAMVMALAIDKLEIPLNELCFKSIKALD